MADTKKKTNGNNPEMNDNRTPYGGLFYDFPAFLRLSPENLSQKEETGWWKDGFPVYDLAKKCADLNANLKNYHEEKEKAGGIFSPEKEQEFRLKIYDSVVSASVTYDKVMKAVENKQISREIKKTGLLENDPFYYHPLSENGTKSTAAGLATFKRGLENGWNTDDLATLSSFKTIADTITGTALGNANPGTDLYETYETPKWASEETKEHISKMNALYEEMLSKPLTDKEQRKAYLDRMESLVSDGIKNNLFRYISKDGSVVSLKEESGAIGSYKEFESRRELRDKLIEEGSEPASYPVIDRFRNLNQMEAGLNARRDDLRFASENREHRAVREAFENYGKYVKENPLPEKEADPEKTEEYARKLLNRLDALERNSKLYAEHGMKDSSPDNKERLDGVKNCVDYAREQKTLLMEVMKGRGIAGNYNDVDGFRIALAVNKMSRSVKELEAMQEMPKDAEGWKKLLNCASDVIVGRIATGDSISGRKMLSEYGIFGLKERVGYNRDFQSFLAKCIKENKISGAELVGELMGRNVTIKVKAVKEDTVKEDAGKEKVKENKASAKKSTP